MKFKYGSRKFLVGLLSLMGIAVLLCVGKIDQNIFSNLYMFISASYFLANVSAKKIEPKE